jgi:hypothetical protein
MGIWTTNAGKSYKVNIIQEQLNVMKEMGARFCWFQDNPGINNENNEIYYEDGKDEQGESRRILKQDITVTCENGDRITGYVSHMVAGSACAGTDIGEWFIIQEGTYPTCYIINGKRTEEIIVEDL